MPSRYVNKRVFKTIDSNTNKLLKSREIPSARILETFNIRPLSDEERKKFQTRTIVWQRRTRLFKLAYEFYGDPTLWWVIAWFNQRPTDADYSPGDQVLIPFPLEEVIRRVV